jgi:hypothetical protein
MGSLQTTPIFLFSLPRSGSTLLQHILSAHESIDTANEPYFVLQFLESIREGEIYNIYSQQDMVHRIEDFVQYLPKGMID